MEPNEYILMSKQQDTHWWFRARRKIIQTSIERFIPSASGSSNASLRILEIGSGMGGNFELLAKFGDVYAAEKHDVAIEYSQSLGIAKDVKQAELPQHFPYQGEQFDLVVMLDVLEHIDDMESLKVIVPSLASGGRLLMTVPAFPWLWSNHDRQMHHHRRYTHASLKQVLEVSGLTVHKLSYYNFLLFPAIVATRLWQRLGQKHIPKGAGGETQNPASDLKEHGVFVSKLVERLFASERFMLPYINLPFGVSLIAVASKDKTP